MFNLKNFKRAKGHKAQGDDFTMDINKAVEDILTGKSCVAFMSKLHAVDGEDKLDHRMITRMGFKDDDFDLCLIAYRDLINDHLRTRKKTVEESPEVPNDQKDPK